jgi:hypothetical protein
VLILSRNVPTGNNIKTCFCKNRITMLGPLVFEGKTGVTAGQGLSIFSSECHFVNGIRKWKQYAQLRMVLIISLKLYQNQASSLTWKLNKIFIFIGLAAKRNVSAICIAKNGTGHSCEETLKFRWQFDLWKPDTILLFLAFAVDLCSGAETCRRYAN